ncbi:Emc1p [Ascoidea rubescens DSM 1968]|uniref:ER membrane protein complex subunit 1 n=1 Tax=Ascoidea rubescens DSM 1968 TaxID=1344418 RepID=A0A1D2VEN6_9ASCO|nr:DUF1620-domain-containing protein [Ascoidea rubescens DSM 1968]ODV60096.1 DUF1620-domain-containing protein [Ascoidea rubescens DSM 1968]
MFSCSVRKPSLFIWFLLFYVSLVQCVYDDEAFKVDWQIASVGEVNNHHLSQSIDLVSLISDDKVLSVVDFQTGNIKWRYNLNEFFSSSNGKFEVIGDQENPNFPIFTLNDDNYLLTLVNSNIFIWNLKKGFLIDHILFTSESDRNKVFKVNENKFLIFDSSSNCVIEYSYNSSSEIFESSVLLSDIQLKFDDSISVSPINNAGDVLIYYKNLNNVIINSSISKNVSQIEIESKLLKDDYLLYKILNNLLIFQNANYYLILSVDVNENSIIDEKLIFKNQYSIINSKNELFILSVDNDLSKLNSSSLELNEISNFNSISSSFSGSVSGSKVYFIKNNKYIITLNEYSIDFLSITFDNKLKKIFNIYNPDLPSLNLIKSIDFKFDSEKNCLNYLVLTNDLEILKFINDTLIWKKYQSLSMINGYQILNKLSNNLDITDNSNYKDFYNHNYNADYNNYKTLMHIYYNRLVRFKKLISEFVHRNLINFNTHQYENFKHLNNYFGFEKLVIVSTKIGQFFLIDLENGKVLDKSYNYKDLTKKNEIDKRFYQVFRNEGYFDIDHDNKFTISEEKNEICGLDNENKSWCQRYYNGNEIYSVKVNNLNVVGSDKYFLKDKRIVYKYLNYKIILVSVTNKIENTLMVNVFDYENGDLIYSNIHKNDIILNDKNKISMVIDENFLIYSYFSLKPSIGNKIFTVEFFKDEERLIPIFGEKTFNLNGKIQDLSVSRSQFGVTTKSIIIEMNNGEIFYAPKFLLSKGPDFLNNNIQDKKSSNIINNKNVDSQNSNNKNKISESNLLINDRSVITHKRQLLNAGFNDEQLNGLVSIPTNLESTIITCSFKNDFFCTRIYPSLQFDLLNSSFGKNKLIFTLAILVIVYLGLKPKVESKKLRNQWINESS